MKTILIAILIAGVAALGQDTPIMVQPGEVTIRLNTTAGASGSVFGPRIFQFVGAQPIGGETIKGAPYSAEAVTETTQVLADGNRIMNSRSSMQYRDGMGRERREETLMGPAGQGPTPKIVFISDPVANTNLTLNPQERTAEKMPGVTVRRGVSQRIELGTPGAAPATIGPIKLSSRMILNGQPDQGTVKTEDLGSKFIEGVSANGTRITHTIPAGQIGNLHPIQIVDESWFSPELHMTVMSTHNDPREGETIYRLANIVRAEPDPTLFQPPADYRIIEPTWTTKE